MPSEFSEGYLTNPRTLQFWASALVVLPVFLQAPWVHFHPISACLFTFVLLGCGFILSRFGGEKWARAASLLVGVSGSWLGGCLFWGWLREYPVMHLPVEAIALPLAFVGLETRWRIGASFYLSCLLGAAFTDLMMLFTGVMHSWPDVVKASLLDAPQLLHETAEQLFKPQSILLLLIAGVVIVLIANLMKERALIHLPSGSAWLVASAALMTTLWVDGLFFLTALIHPTFSGLI
ncbi:DUF3120 domain-containing protein [Prochlorococcus sp. MIT 1307]|uniref:DUF3120 domain-containing protein n=1 Tax=Prochlorococcus sp. MIT 1307 TaxID=3096219 RepID=UPI002A75E297|nr:DUF3120 domain-containing protein [Prochlorococcus sp. MIT 1307]